MNPVKVLALRYLANADPALCQGFGAPRGYSSLAMLTTDSDDATYIALDQATKAADVKVCFAQSFYAGEVMGILAGATPGAVRSGMEAALSALERVGFEEVAGVPYLAYTISSAGSFLSAEAGVREGEALAYLIAPPLESVYALDAALKASEVRLAKLYAPPSRTNFGGALLTGTRSACSAACIAFAEAVAAVAQRPMKL